MTKKPTTGLVLRGDRLEWIEVRADGTDRPLDAPPREGALDLGGTPGFLEALQKDAGSLARQVRELCGPLPGTVTIGLPSCWVLVKVLSLPSAAPEELQGMVELQADKFSPFPADDIVVTYETLHEADGVRRVLVAAVRKATIESIGGVFRLAGIVPARVDINGLAWWHLIRQVPGSLHAAGSQLFILHDAFSCDLLLTHEGIPLLFRPLGPFPGMSPEEIADDIVREVMSTLASLEAETAGVLAPIALWHRDAEPVDLAERLRRDLEMEVQCASVQALPPLARGLAARSLLPAGTALNLAPPAWREQERAQLSRRRILAASVGVLGAWLAALLVLFGGLYYHRHTLARMHNTLEGLKEPAEHVRKTQKLALDLEQYNDHSRSALECLLEVSRSMPDGIELKSFNYRKGKAVELGGNAASATLVYDFKRVLDQSAVFRGIELDRISVSGSRGGEAFRMTAKLPEVQE